MTGWQPGYTERGNTAPAPGSSYIFTVRMSVQISGLLKMSKYHKGLWIFHKTKKGEKMNFLFDDS